MAVKYEKLTAVLIAAVNELADEVRGNRELIREMENILIANKTPEQTD
jgi:hypothetical protein